MKIEDANVAFGYNIVGGTSYGWQECWPNARCIEYRSPHAAGSVIFSTGNGMIFQAVVRWLDDRADAYRWMNPSWSQRWFQESRRRGIVGGDQWTDLETWSDFAEKAGAMIRGVEPDRRIQVPVDLSDEEFLNLAKRAHEQDITVNEMVARFLQEQIDARKDAGDDPSDEMNEVDEVDEVGRARAVRDEFRELCTRPHQTRNDDTSTSDTEHSVYWEDRNRNK